MAHDPLAHAPKPGALVQSHLPEIFEYIATVDGEEFERLLTREYSGDQFRLSSYPFVKLVEQIGPVDTVRYWKPEYTIHGQRVRVCSQWTKRHRPFFLNYLVGREIPVTGISPELCEEWLAIAEQAGTTSKAPGGARYRSHAIGITQNSFVRYLLSNLGHEEFTESDWQAVKASFGNSCAYCGAAAVLEMDHAIPLSRLQLGEHRLGNLVLACKPCNGKKSHLRFRPYLASKYELDRSEGDSRITAIESHMARNGYRPLGERQDVRELVEQGRHEVAALAAKYLNLINDAIGWPNGSGDAGEPSSPDEAAEVPRDRHRAASSGLPGQDGTSTVHSREPA